MIRLGTLFSGIGAIEQALLRMNLKHSLVFACDNGELDLKLLPSDEQNEYDNLKKITKKNITEEESRRLYVLRQKEEETISKIAHYVSQLPSIHCLYLQPIITQYFIDNKSEIWLLFLIAHSKR